MIMTKCFDLVKFPDGGGTQVEREIDKIIKTSQRNNTREGVTGAMMFISGVFGQVLEGPAGSCREKLRTSSNGRPAL